MRLLHTADWHLGKTLARRNRDAEHAEALRTLLDLVEQEQPDALLVAGDVFDCATPPPEAERQLYTFLTDMSRLGVPTVMIAGNHDNPRRLAALRPLLQLAGVRLVERPGTADDAVVELNSRDGRERLVVGCLPWLSDRYVAPDLDEQVRAVLAEQAEARRAARRSKRTKAARAAQQLFDEYSAPPGARARSALKYAERARGLMALVAQRFRPDTVNVLLAHLFFDGARPGGGERDCDMDARYRLTTRDLPGHTHYVALGHVHRPQLIDVRDNVPVRYAGSLLQLAFSEAAQQKSVVLIEAEPGVGVTDCRELPIVAGRALTDVAGTREELQRRAAAGDFGNDYLRVTLRGEPARPGLADEVRAFLPDAVQVRLDALAQQPGAHVVGTPRAEVSDLLELYRSYHQDVVGSELPALTADALRVLLDAELRGEPTTSVIPVAEQAGPAPAGASLFASLDADDAGRYAGRRVS